ncbi:MAG TPA: prepilin-type N-terminal cleavage/methylation domain-containing protein [Phycisphaerae bacterium]|nr:prepilin-type N-terminal cleavage/methylation domain-containing protein [Phycisphaerae bacterium]
MRRCRTAGFTLAEVLVCTVLLALAFVALVAAYGYQSVVIQRGEEITYGTFLADEIRDMALRMDLADVLNLDGTTYSPAMLSTGTQQAQTQYTQQIAITPVVANDLSTQVAPAQANAARVAVTVTAYGKPIVVQSYYVFDLAGVPFK